MVEKEDYFPKVFEDKIRGNAKEKEEASRELSSARYDELTQNPIKGDYDLEHFSKIHKYLFQDISTQAGVVRNYGMSKNLSKFANSSQLSYLFDKELPKRLDALKQSGNNKNKYIDGLTDLHSTLDLAHPFREGNGRATRAFMSQIAKDAGYKLDFSKINQKEWLNAVIHSINAGNEEIKRPLFEKITTYNLEKETINPSNKNKPGSLSSNRVQEVASKIDNPEHKKSFIEVASNKLNEQDSANHSTPPLEDKPKDSKKTSMSP